MKKNQIERICAYCGIPYYTRPSKNLVCCSWICHSNNRFGKKRGKLKVTKKGENHARYKGKVIIKQGYFLVWAPSHKRARNGRVMQSALIAERCLGRELNSKELIHHIDENKLNDNPNNLYLFPSKREHVAFHFSKIKQNLKSNLPS